MPQVPEASLSEGGTPAVTLPTRPASEDDEPSDPYKKIAADFEAAIRCGALEPDDQLPSIKDIAARYRVAASTSHRAIALLAERGKIVVAPGRRAKVAIEGYALSEDGTAVDQVAASDLGCGRMAEAVPGGMVDGS